MRLSLMKKNAIYFFSFLNVDEKKKNQFYLINTLVNQKLNVTKGERLSNPSFQEYSFFYYSSGFFIAHPAKTVLAAPRGNIHSMCYMKTVTLFYVVL